MRPGIANALKRRGLIGALALGLGLAAMQAATAEDFDYDSRRPAELRACDDHRDHGRADQAKGCYDRLLQSSRDASVQAEAAWALGDVRRANEFFRAAVQADENAVRPRVRWGRLYLQTHQYSDAADLFREALEIDADDVQARLSMARLLSDQFDGDARTIVGEVIDKGNERDRVQAHALIEALLLSARMDLDDGKHGTAERSLERATKLAQVQKQPPLEAYELLAALDLLRGDEKASRWIERSLAYNPRYGGVFETLAHYEVMRRRYHEASGWLRKAVETQPDRWSAQAELGVNLLRLGEVDESRKALEKAYSGDPFSATTVNTLRVLDKLKDFSVTRVNAPDIVTWLDKKESEAMRPYVEEVGRQSIATFSKRYGFEPKLPVTIELYPNHDDFAVRTAGLPGIGLLGVTFGYLVAMDSPSGRAAGDFHWGSTLWHEMAHVFTLSVTDHRVPRWLSEGMSVFEEWTHWPDAGHRDLPARARRVPRRQVPARGHARRGLHPPRVRRPGAGVVHAGRPRLRVHRAAAGASRSSWRCCASSRKTPPPLRPSRRRFRISPKEFDKEFTHVHEAALRRHTSTDPKRMAEDAWRDLRGRGTKDWPGVVANAAQAPSRSSRTSRSTAAPTAAGARTR